MPTDRTESRRQPGRFAYDGLERVIHEKARLSILSSLAAYADGLLFTELRNLCALTDGNLSRQIQLLQETGLVEVWKRQTSGRQQTLCRLTPAGRQRFFDYISQLERVVSDAQARDKSPRGHASLIAFSRKAIVTPPSA